MRLNIVAVGALACVLCACAYPIRNADVVPGGTVSQTDPVLKAMSALSPSSNNTSDQWKRFRVYATEPNVQCMALGDWFANLGPERSGRTDAQGAAMLTYDSTRKVAHFECNTSAGKLTRRIPGYEYTYTAKVVEREYSYGIWPPIVHMNPDDPLAEQHWASTYQEICGAGRALRYSPLCEPAIWSAVKKIDLQR